MTRTQLTLVSIVSALGLAISAFAQREPMTPKQADRILARAGEQQPSYISAEQAANIFHFNGRLTVSESAQWGDDDDISNVIIKPDDKSFDSIRIAIGKGGAFFNQFDLNAKLWTPNSAQNQNPFTSFQFPDGSKGYSDGYGSVVLTSPDGRFDIRIEMTIAESGRDPIKVTASNKELVEGLTGKNDHGLKFLSDAMTGIYPLAKKKYEDQVKARTSLIQAQKVMEQLSPSNNPTPTPSAGPSSPSSVSATPQVSPAQTEPSKPKEEPPASLVWLYSLAAIILAGLGLVIYRSRKR